MKFVQKGGPPHKYRAWCRAVVGTAQEDYRDLPGDVKSQLLPALAKEQGDICAYTMKRIDKDSSHIEHIKPEGFCRAEKAGSDLDFSNMVACFPRAGMPRVCRYGAQKKDSWWDPTLFVSPLNPACEKRFRFSLDGQMLAVDDNEAASNTIGILALNHPSLAEDRRRAIQELIYGENGSAPLSRTKASRLRDEVCVRSKGMFVEFCVALRDALDAHIKYIEKLARKRSYARRGER